MSLNVHYDTMKNYTENFSDNAIKQADTLGWLMMGIGINEITEKNIPEILFRMRFLDFVYVKPYFTSNPSDKSITMLLEDHIGLETNGSVSTRHKYIVNIAKNLANDIDYKLTEENNK